MAALRIGAATILLLFFCGCCRPTARCRDGTTSCSQNRRGTCSHHGGVAQWIADEPVPQIPSPSPPISPTATPKPSPLPSRTSNRILNTDNLQVQSVGCDEDFETWSRRRPVPLIIA